MTYRRSKVIAAIFVEGEGEFSTGIVDRTDGEPRGRGEKMLGDRANEDLLELVWRASTRKGNQNERPVASFLSFPFVTSKHIYIKFMYMLYIQVRINTHMTSVLVASRLADGPWTTMSTKLFPINSLHYFCKIIICVTRIKTACFFLQQKNPRNIVIVEVVFPFPLQIYSFVAFRCVNWQNSVFFFFLYLLGNRATNCESDVYSLNGLGRFLVTKNEKIVWKMKK